METLTHIYYPVLIIIFSVLSYILWRTIVLQPFIVLIIFTTLTYTVYNQKFLFWTGIYIFLSMAVTGLCMLVHKHFLNGKDLTETVKDEFKNVEETIGG